MKKLLALFSALTALPGAAWAAFTCVGPTPVGTMLGVTASCAAATAPNAIFSSLICDYEQVISAVLSIMYCGIQYALKPTLVVLITLYVAVHGIKVLVGAARITLAETQAFLAKMLMVWAFATMAEYGIDIMYYFFTGAAQDGISWILSQSMWDAGMPAGVATSGGVFVMIDSIAYTIIMSPFSSGGAKIFGFIMVMSFVHPPIFLMFFYFFMKLVRIFIRALMTYMLGISCIAFLIALSPIFLSFALFQATYNMFDNWLRHLISFTLQIVLVFMFTAVWLMVFYSLGDFFIQLGNVVVPYEKTWWFNAFRDPKSTFGICDYAVVGNNLQCISDTILPPEALLNDTAFMFFITYNLLIFTLVAYAFDTLMAYVPDVARQLAGPRYAPALGGGGSIGAMNFAGEKSFSRYTNRFGEGFGNTSGGLLTKISGGFKESYEEFKRKATPAAQFKEMIGDQVARR